MPDFLVKTLNAIGYQPVLLPRTGVVPPELYSFAQHRLIRHGSLKNYLANISLPTPSRGELSDIEAKQTSGKKFGAAADFLKSALAVLGIASVPKLDLSFAGSGEFVFSFTNVTFESVDPADLEPLLPHLSIPPAISDDVVALGQLHIAYEYAYSDTLRMSRADSSAFATDIGGKVGDFIDVSGSATVEVQGNRVISFSSTTGERAAFAYKAGQVLKQEERWIFQPETVMRDGLDKPQDYVPARGVVLRVEELGS